MKWFKFYGQDYLSDPKMLALSASERSCWITLLAYASVNDNGKITFLSEEQLMMQAGLSFQHDEWDMTKGILKKLEKLEMIQIDNEVITVKNWQKRQETSLTNYERVKRFREKKRNDNVMITSEENRRDKKRIDKEDVVDEPATFSPAEIAKEFFLMGSAYTELLEVFSQNNNPAFIETEFKKFILWWTEPNKTGKKQRWELEKTFEVKRRLYTWLSRSNQFKNVQKSGRGLEA